MKHETPRSISWKGRLFVLSALVSGLMIASAGMASGSGLEPPGSDTSPTVERMYQAQLRLIRTAHLEHRARMVIAAAKSQIGVPYVYASARPKHGFDCSGLVMWAWSRVGVHLPHNSTEIYRALPHVARESLRAGDILYFREPQDHVAIYVGSGRMIHAPHTGLTVRIEPVYWRYLAGIARPGR
jgi:cell wall-associated NlpC family hydrolase